MSSGYADNWRERDTDIEVVIPNLRIGDKASVFGSWRTVSEVLDDGKLNIFIRCDGRLNLFSYERSQTLRVRARNDDTVMH